MEHLFCNYTAYRIAEPSNFGLPFPCCIIAVMANEITIDFQLKEASQLTNAAWSALVEREAGKWRVVAQYRLGKKLQTALANFLTKTEVDTWLSGALSGGQSRSVSLPESNGMTVARLYAFPAVTVSRVVMVGA